MGDLEENFISLLRRGQYIEARVFLENQAQQLSARREVGEYRQILDMAISEMANIKVSEAIIKYDPHLYGDVSKYKINLMLAGIPKSPNHAAFSIKPLFQNQRAQSHRLRRAVASLYPHRGTKVRIVTRRTRRRVANLANPAMFSPEKGGIDLQQINLASRGGGVQTAFSNPEQLELLKNASGLIPLIYGIKPVNPSIINTLLGLNGNPSSGALSSSTV